MKGDAILTGKQEKFCQGVADGLTQADAYRAAYNASGMRPESVQVSASKLMADHKISQRVTELRGKLAERLLWTREQSVDELKAAIALAKETETPAAITSAIKELNAMHGYNAPAKLDVTTNGESLNAETPAQAAIARFLKAASEAE